jgi:hypothetical protein
VQPGNANASSQTESLSPWTVFFHDANDLVAGNYGRFARRELTFDHVQVRAADAAGADAQENVAATRHRLIHIDKTKGIRLNAGRSIQNTRLQEPSSFAPIAIH